MPEHGSVRRAWSALSAPWQEAVQMAWRPYRDGGVAVGAVLTDNTGAVIGRGRNQRFGLVSPRGLLAHAEMAALAALPGDKDRARDTVLYTTLHPCPMCLGAVVVARVGRVCFGVYDPTWVGLEELPRLNTEVRSRWPQFEGPLSGRLGEWLAILPCLNTDGALMRAMQATAPRLADRARAVARRLDRESSLPETADQAFAQAWDLLTSQQ